MEMNRELRRKARKARLQKCPECSNYMNGQDDMIRVDSQTFCFDCGCKKGQQLMDDSNINIIILGLDGGIKRLYNLVDIQEIYSILSLPEDFKLAVNFSYGRPELWMESGDPGSPARRVIRVGIILKGFGLLEQYIKPLDIKNLTPDPEDKRESEHFILTPMRDRTGMCICYNLLIKETGKEILVPLDGFIGSKSIK